ncbi:MAG: peptidoglycan-binding protein [Rhodobacteraceae bacterium]|nr:peptidoglycan-binding protein [Paracoccaceae bacterium]
MSVPTEASDANAVIIPCGGPFETFLGKVKNEAHRRGHARDTIARFFQSAARDPDVLRMDRNQGIFRKPFIEFSQLVMNEYRIVKGREFADTHGRILAEVQDRFGIQPGVLLSLMALETDYGLVQGDFNTLNALLTLSHDCRRPGLFQPHLFAALHLFERGDFDPVRTTGAWAGEIGMIQMLPADLVVHGIDHDRNGRVDVSASVGDALMTAGNVLQHHGWVRDQPWLIEVDVPDDLDWKTTGLDIFKPISEWARQGVTIRSSMVPNQGTTAALVLPHGHKGPAFLATRNFLIYLKWNRSLVYALTSAFFATLLSGEDMYREGAAAPQLSLDDTIRLQTLLAGRGHDVGPIDGIIGAKTRAAVRSEQVRLDQIADSWPTAELLSSLESGS